MLPMEKVAVYIDGGNLYRRLKDLGIPSKGKRFDMSAFVQHLLGERHLVSKRYYVGIVKNYDSSEKGSQLVIKQQQYLDSLRKEGFEVKKGKIMYDNGTIREKGVDVKIATDLVVGASDNLYDSAIVVSSDTDLIPAIKYVINGKKKKAEYVGFDGRVSMGMIGECSSQRVFGKQDLLSFEVFKQVEPV